MNNFIKNCWGEMVKQKQNYFNSPMTYITSILWPVLNCIIAYYTYSAFDISKLTKYGIDTKENLLMYIFTGLLAYNSFWLMIQSALYIQRERENGTIEITFLSPANRLALVYGRAFGSLIQNIWMFMSFSVVIFLISKNTMNVRNLLFGFIVLIISSVIWGGFINSIFLVSRDIDFWFNLCDCPMNLLSGTKLPIAALPTWLQWGTYIFPLTYCLIVIRKIFTNGRLKGSDLILLFICLVIIIVITKVILYVSEKINRKTGNLQLY